jgi:hypothetical protein
VKGSHDSTPFQAFRAQSNDSRQKRYHPNGRYLQQHPLSSGNP